MESNTLRCRIKRFLNAVAGGAHHLGVNAKFLAVVDLEIILGGIGVEHGGNVILGMARRKKHSGHGEHARHTLGFQGIKTIADNRRGKFEIAIFHRVLRQALFQVFGEHGEFGDRVFIAAAMATQHYAQFF